MPFDASPTPLAAASNSFDAASFPVDVPAHQRESFATAWEWLGRPGTAWTAAEKVAIAETARTAQPRPLWNRRPSTIDHLAVDVADGETLSPLVADTVERVAIEAGAIEPGWATAAIDAIGDLAYAELVATVVSVVTVDTACRLLGRDPEPLPHPMDGAPSGDRAVETTDIGAYLPVAVGFPGANVARSLSVAPEANLVRLRIVRALYSGTRFGELTWDDGTLNRPQVELIAARTSALNECFY